MIRRWLAGRTGDVRPRRVQAATAPGLTDLLSAAENAAGTIEHAGLQETARTEIAIAYARLAPEQLAGFLNRLAGEPLPSHKMAEAAAVLACSGASDEAAALATSYPEAENRDLVLVTAGEAAAAAGYLDAADRLGLGIDDPRLRDRIAYRQVQRDLADDRRDRATERLHGIDDPFFRGAAEAALIRSLDPPARAAAAASLATRLSRLIDGIDGASRADHLRLELARALISGRQIEAAEVVIDAIGVTHFRAEGFLALAKAALADGDVAAMWQAIDRIGSLHLRATGLSALALQAASSGNATLALQMVDAIDDADVAAETLSGLAGTVWDGQRNALETRMDAIADPVLRAQAWIAAAALLTDSDAVSASELLSKADSLAAEEPPTPSQGRLLQGIVSGHLRVADRQSALAALERLRGRPHYLVAAARCQAALAPDPEVAARLADAFASLGSVTRGAQHVQALLDAALGLHPGMADGASPI